MTIPMQVSRQQVVEEARSWIDVRWKHQGRNRAGIDCIGLVVMTMKAFDIPVEDLTGYRRSPNPAIFMTGIQSQLDLCSQPLPGGVAIFREALQPCHVGIFAGTAENLTLIHGYAPYGRVREEPFTNQWPRLLVETRQFRELIDG